MAHPIVHIEIPVKDADTGSGFYGELFGWKIAHHDEMNYVSFDPGDGVGGGFPVSDSDGTGNDGVLLYVGTDDIPGMLNQAETLGATVESTKAEIPGVGYMGVFRDPSGNRVALFTPLGEGSEG